MANYCFVERDRELFHEAALRGWLAATLDFPYLKSGETCISAAHQSASEMKPEICCIPAEDDSAYRTLVTTAFYAAYSGYEQVTEREAVMGAAVLKPKSYAKALAWLRHVFTVAEGIHAEIDRVYAQFLTVTNQQNPGPRSVQK